MTEFYDTLSQAADDILEDSVAGLSAIYTPISGDPVSCNVIFSREVEHMPVVFESGMMAHKPTIRAKLTTLGKIPEYGDYFEINEKSGFRYYVDSPEATETDDTWAVCIVREVAT